MMLSAGRMNRLPIDGKVALDCIGAMFLFILFSAQKALGPRSRRLGPPFPYFHFSFTGAWCELVFSGN